MLQDSFPCENMLFQSQASIEFFDKVKAAPSWEEAYNLVKQLKSLDIIEIVTGSRNFWTLKTHKIHGTLAVSVVRPTEFYSNWYIARNNEEFFRVTVHGQTLEELLTPPDWDRILVTSTDYDLENLDGNLRNEIIDNVYRIARCFASAVHLQKPIPPSQKHKLSTYLIHKLNSRMEFEQANARRISRLMVTHHLTDLEKKIYAGMNLKPNQLYRLSVWRGIAQNDFSKQDAWLIPVVAYTAYEYGISVSALKELFRKAGGTQGAWKYLCSLRHLDADVWRDVAPSITSLKSLTQIANLMVASGAHKAPKHIQHLLVNRYSYSLTNDTQGIDEFFISRSNVLKPLMEKVAKWSKRPKGLLFDATVESYEDHDENGDILIRHRFVASKKYAKTKREKISPIADVFDWYLANYRYLSKEILDLDFKHLYKHSMIWRYYRRRENSPSYSWTSYLGTQDITVDGHQYTIVPLTSTQMLFSEARSNKNCVDTYTGSCIKEDSRFVSRIFSVRGHERLTLEIRKNSTDNIWYVAQNHGPLNSREIESSSKKLGELVAMLYQGAYELNGQHPAFAEVLIEGSNLYHTPGPLHDCHHAYTTWLNHQHIRTPVPDEIPF